MTRRDACAYLAAANAFAALINAAIGNTPGLLIGLILAALFSIAAR